MSKAKHTQGPWEFLAEPGYCSQINGADGTVICCFDEDPKPEDARLMIMGPVLLAALKGMDEAMCNAGNPHMSKEERAQGRAAIIAARAAIAEVEGVAGKKVSAA